MKSLRSILLFIILLFFFSSCKTANEEEVFDISTIKNEIVEMFHGYHQAVAEKGLTGEFSYLDHTSDYFWVPPGYNSAIGYDSTEAILKTNAQQFDSVLFSWETLQVFPLSKTYATYTGIVSSTMRDTSGQVNQSRIIESGTLVKRTDGWKLLSGQSRLLDQ